MLLERRELKKESDKTTIIEAYFDSTNIAKSNYIPERNLMFIFFNDGLVYSYSNITSELYDGFENAKSQGKYFITEIKKKPTIYKYLREYKLYEFERQDIMKIIDGLRDGKEDENSNNLTDFNV